MSGDNAISVPRQLYYDQQLLKVDDFQREQDYHARLRELQTRLLCTPGILTGLDVVPGAGATAVKVDGGTAIDSAGRLVTLVDRALLRTVATTTTEKELSLGNFAFDLNDPRYYTIGGPRTWRLTISFRETQDGANQMMPAPLLQLTEGAADPDVLALADLTVTATQVTASDPKSPVDRKQHNTRAAGPRPAPPMTTTVTIAIDTTVAVKAAFAGALIPPLDAGILGFGTVPAARLPSLDATKISGTLDVDRLPTIPAAKIAAPLTAEQIPLLAELLRRVQALEQKLAALTTLATPVTRGLDLAALGLEAHWTAVAGAERYEIQLLSEPHPLAIPPQVDILLAPPAGQQEDPAHSYPLARFSGVTFQPGDGLTFRVRAVARAAASAWSDNTAGSSLGVPTAAAYADRLRAEGVTAQEAETRIARVLAPGMPPAEMMALLAARFPESMASPTQQAWALANGGFDGESTGAALLQAGVGLPDMAAALKAVYPPPDVARAVEALRRSCAPAAVAAASLKAAYADLTPLEIGVMLVRSFPADTGTATLVAAALQQAGFSAEQTGPVITELFPLLTLADIEAALRATFGTEIVSQGDRAWTTKSRRPSHKPRRPSHKPG